VYAENEDQANVELLGTRAANQALRHANGRRLVTLPDWLSYCPEQYQGADIMSRFWQSGFIKHWNFFASLKGWPLFRHVLPPDGYKK
jgi:hypothetical protein